MPVKLDELEAALRSALSIQHLVRPLVAHVVDIQKLTGSFQCPCACLYPLYNTIGLVLFFINHNAPCPIHFNRHTFLVFLSFRLIPE